MSLEQIVELKRRERLQAHLVNTQKELIEFVKKPRGQTPLPQVPNRNLMVEGLGMELTLPFLSNPSVNLENFHNDWDANSIESDPSETPSYDCKTFNFLMDKAHSQTSLFPLINPNRDENDQLKQAKKSLSMIDKMKDVFGVTSKQEEELSNQHFNRDWARIDEFNKRPMPLEGSDDATSAPYRSRKHKRARKSRHSSNKDECFVE